MKELILKYKVSLFFTIISVVISSLAVIFQPDVISNIINALNETDVNGHSDPNMQEVYKYSFRLLALGGASLFFGIMTVFFSAKIAQGVGADLREKQFAKIQSFSLKEVDEFQASHLIVRMTNDVTQIQNFLMMGLNIVVRVPVIFIGAFVLSIVNFPQMWWAIILYVILVALVQMLAMGKMGPLFKGLQKDVDSVNTIVKENMEGVRVVKSFVTEKKEEKRFAKKVFDLTQKYENVGVVFSVIIPSYMLFANLLTVVAVYLTSFWAADNIELIGSVSSFTMYLMQIMFALIMAGMLTMTMQRAVVSYKRIKEVLVTENELVYGDEELDEINSIEFKDVEFKYSNDSEKILKKVSFKIEKGEKIGIVGLTGSGKTTLANLFLRLYDRTSGEIYINGIEIEKYNEDALKSKISIVLQKAILFSGTIEDNIRQGKKDATMEEMIEAAKAAQAFEFIEKKDGKFQAEVLERGNNFSGGQKQRLSITRGLVKKPELLILDDSTSALDAKSERLVKEAINKIDDKITIIIAQKIASIHDMDKIIVLKEGEVEAFDSHSKLLETSPMYQEIFESQRGKGVK